MIPVPEAEAAVDLLRRRHTQDGADGMPAHVTLIYPFTDASSLVAGRIHDVRTVLEPFAPFAFQLAHVRRFDNLPNESHTWLAPTPTEPFLAMIEALATAFPEHPPFGGVFPTVIPHLTVAASTDERVLRAVEEKVAEALPIDARATTVRIMEQVDQVWRLRAEIPL